MAINFCYQSLGTKVLCNHVFTENHEAGNLISGELMRRSRGFLAESFLKPPVDIVLQFPCPVNVICVVINGKLYSQQTIGCELMVAVESGQSGLSGAPLSIGAFNSVGKYYWDSSMRGVHVHTSHGHLGLCQSSENSEYSHHRLTGNYSRLLAKVHSMQVRILKTTASSVPALAGLSVWGYVHPSCNPHSARSLLQSWRDIVCPIQESGIPTEKEDSPGAEIDPADIPEDFLDSLTFEIMSLPVRLPSGSVIDEQTLDRWKKQEATWGRPTSDPFTGQLLTQQHKPLYDVALKARIDAFLTRESHERKDLQTVPRTLGTIKRSSDSLLDNPKPSKTPRPPQQQQHPTPVAQLATTVDPSRRLLSSLAANLKNVSRATAKQKRPAHHLQKPAANECHCCSSKQVLYYLPCRHYICRQCLLNKKQAAALECDLCSAHFTVDQPVRSMSADASNNDNKNHK